jgi:hypothetical protein
VETRSRSPLYILIACLMLLGLIPPLGSNAAAQTPTAAGTPIPLDNAWSPGQTVRIQNARGDLQVDAAVTELSDPHPSRTASRRGYRVVGVKLTLTNRGSATFEHAGNQLLLLDDAGLYVWDMQYLRVRREQTEQSLNWREIKPGESISGWLYYEILSAAKPAGLLYLGYESDPYAALLARFIAGQAGESETILDRSAAPLGTIQVEQILTSFERTDPSITPFRGMRAVALVVSVANTGDKTWDLQDSIILVDQFGLVYTRWYYDRSAASKGAYPELKNRVHPGQTERGVIVFEIPADSSIDVIALVRNQEQFIVLGGGYASITATPEKYVATASDEEWGSSAPGCEGIREWAEGSLAAMKMANEILSGIQADVTRATPEALRRSAASLRYAASLQVGVIAPTKAREAQGDLIALLRAGADALDDAATRIENGESPKTVVDQIDAPKSPFMLAANKALASSIAATVACPLD